MHMKPPTSIEWKTYLCIAAALVLLKMLMVI
jgi:hypothetical protein